jgi:putative ABC transport system permease protein
VDAAVPLVYAGGTATLGDATRNVDIFGAPERGPGMPTMTEGRPPSTPDEVAVSSTLERKIGDDVEIASRRLRIVGIVENSTALANLPNVFLTTQGAQQLVYGGGSLVSSIGIRGNLEQIPEAYRGIDRAGAIADLLRPLKVAVSSITIVAVLLWVIAALVVGSVIYLSALERLRDFAVFKAIGVSTRNIAAGLAMQSVIVALLAALLGAGLSRLLGPLFPMQVIVPAEAFIALPVVAVVIGLIASATGLRRAGIRRSVSHGRFVHPEPDGRVRQWRRHRPPDRRPQPRRGRRLAGDSDGPEWLREDDAVVVPWRHPAAQRRRHQVRRRRRHISRYPRTVDLPPRHGGHRVPGVQSRAQPHRDRERDGADECGGHVAPRGP